MSCAAVEATALLLTQKLLLGGRRGVVGVRGLGSRWVQVKTPCEGCQQTCYSCQEACQGGLPQQPLQAGKDAAGAGVSHRQMGLQRDAPSPWRRRGHGRAFCGACPLGYHTPCVCPASLPIQEATIVMHQPMHLPLSPPSLSFLLVHMQSFSRQRSQQT